MKTSFENINRLKAAKEAIRNFQEKNDHTRLRFHLKNAFSALVSKDDYNTTMKSEAFIFYCELLGLLTSLEPMRPAVEKPNSTNSKGDEFFR